MYGMIGKMTAVAGQRDNLLAILLGEAGKAMPGCISYVVARDQAHPDVIWITEVWDSEANHRASLDLPDVKAAIARAMPLIAAFDKPQVTEPLGGLIPRPADPHT